MTIGFEQARAAARLVKIRYDVLTGDYELAPNVAKAEKPADQFGQKTDSIVGNFEAAFAAAALQVDSKFTTPFEVHAQMEPHATVAYWKDGKVTIHCCAQLLKIAQNAVAATLKMPAASVRTVSRYIGGGFGGKLPIYGDVMLSAMAARQLDRPVKTALTRQQMFHFTTHRSNTIQRVLDPRFGYFANHDLAEYHVPTHADILAVEAHFLQEVDAKTNPLKIKGVGELGICGAGAAVANAVYNACGARIRDYPLTLDKVLAGTGGAARSPEPRT